MGVRKPATNIRYDLTAPCSDCPFRADHPCKLDAANAIDIATSMTFQPDTFAMPCHKTIVYDKPETWEGITIPDGAQHCAGALIFADRQALTSTYTLRALAAGKFDPGKWKTGTVVVSMRLFLRNHVSRQEQETLESFQEGVTLCLK